MSPDPCEERCAREDMASMTAFYDCSEAAFNALVERWRPRLFGFFRRHGMRVEDAEDLVLQTLVKLYTTKERRSFDVTRPLSPFLFTVARRTYLGWVRDQSRLPVEVPLIEALDLATPEKDPCPEVTAHVAQCVEGLPEAEKLYIMHCGKHGLGDLSHGEIAAVMGKWPAQITQISQRARVLLECCLRAKGHR